MERFIKGDIIIVPFPFTDLTESKKRPALIVAELEGDNIILCPISSQKKKDRYAIPIDIDDFESGFLKEKSIIRPNCIFTADRKIVLYKVGELKYNKLRVVIEKIISIIRG